VVHPDANKTEIRQAVETIWGVKVISVNTVNRKGKTKRFRQTLGRRSDSKRAVVKLAAGDKIEIFEQQG
jgi:large subunit ribosomal protein L23